MVKIRLRRIGTKARPFYRVVVAQSTAARNGKFVETIGTYDPIVKPTRIEINEERALHWLMSGAQPTETTAYLLNKIGILGKYFEARPNAKAKFAFLDKRTAAMSVASAVDAPAKSKKAEAKQEAKEEAKAEEPKAEEPKAEAEAAEKQDSAENDATKAVNEPSVEADKTPSNETASEETAKKEGAEEPR